MTSTFSTDCTSGIISHNVQQVSFPVTYDIHVIAWHYQLLQSRHSRNACHCTVAAARQRKRIVQRCESLVSAVHTHTHWHIGETRPRSTLAKLAASAVAMHHLEVGHVGFGCPLSRSRKRQAVKLFRSARAIGTAMQNSSESGVRFRAERCCNPCKLQSCMALSCLRKTATTVNTSLHKVHSL